MLLFDIATVERETGIAKDTLRVWERRYGFPDPERNACDERLYTPSQVERLRLIKRLILNGYKPSQVVGLSSEQLNGLLPPRVPSVSTEYAAEVLSLAALIRSHQAAALRVGLARLLLQQGLSDFLSKTVVPLNQLVGEAWMRNEMRIFEEHLYTDQLTVVLRHAISSLQDGTATPRVLLTTLPGEAHTLGLLMSEAMLNLHGANCLALGAQTPIQEVVGAALAHQSDIVAVSFSQSCPLSHVKNSLQQLRQSLPAPMCLWAGGAGVLSLRTAIAGVDLMGPLTDLPPAIEQWRAANSQP